MKRLGHAARSGLLLIAGPLMLLISAAAILATDIAWFFFGRKAAVGAGRSGRPRAASVVIPNWNGRDLLAKYLPSVVEALSRNPANEILVVDNGSTDGSAQFVRSEFPGVRVLELPRNLGFGGGSNAGFAAARHDIVVLLNSDMRVDPGFLEPLLEGFGDEDVFAVSCQIFFSDPAKRREETGLTEGWWQHGGLRVSHRIDPMVDDLYPCFYGGGGSCAFDRRKFLELGGFDSLLTPFYLEDTDLSYLAWKRGWKVLYQPRSIVYHEHRGTIGKRFSERQIQAVLKKNYILFCWKNIHGWPRLAQQLFFTLAGALISLAMGDEPGRPNLEGIWRAALQLPQVLRSRWKARALSRISDTEAFLRPKGAYYRDRFLAPYEWAGPIIRVLFISPYPICPPIHGGAVFMYQTLERLSRLCEVHVIVVLDSADQAAEHEMLRKFCASVELLVRSSRSSGVATTPVPHAVREFASRELDWLIHRQVYRRRIDVVQLEYTCLGQYGDRFQHIVCALFEHDVYFQSVARALPRISNKFEKLKAAWEYLRGLHYELRLLPRFDQVQVCTNENRRYLESFLPGLRGRIVEGLRAGIDMTRYEFRADGRDPDTLLFLGSFRHGPNQVALEWFVNAVFPMVRARRPSVQLIVVGSDPPPRHAFDESEGSIQLVGFVEDIRPLLASAAVFICPILSGSGVRVKLLEAFASGIPVVSTRVGAEGLADTDGELCRLADTPEDFAERVIELLENPEAGAAMAARARTEVVNNWDMAAITRKLEASYRELLAQKGARVREPARITSG